MSLTESAGYLLSDSEQCCYRTVGVINKDMALRKLSYKLQLWRFVSLATFRR